MKIFNDNHAVNLSGEGSPVIAALSARRHGFVRGCLATSAPVLAACCLLIGLAALQVLFVGVMELLGLAPQVSFLSFNLVLIALFLLLALPPLRLRLRLKQRRKIAANETGVANTGAFSLNVTSPARPVCKVLVIRRSAQGAHAEQHKAWRAFAKGDERHEVRCDA